MWYTIIKLEERTSNDKIVKSLLAEAVKECPQSGELWAMMVESQPRAARIRALLNASEICLNDPYLMNVGARIFWLELKKEKAVAWFERSLMVRPLLGDTWVFYYQFYEEAKDDAMKAEILKRCVQAEPVEGRIWRAFADKPSSWSMSTEQILLGVLDEAKQHMFALRSQF
jgi:pre-mRNA-processing factor 6